MIDQQVPRNRGYPGHERPLTGVIGIQCPVHLDKDLLGEVLGVLRIPRKAIADVINPPVIALDDLLPSRGVARNAATDQQSDNLGIVQKQAPEGRFSLAQRFSARKKKTKIRVSADNPLRTTPMSERRRSATPT